MIDDTETVVKEAGTGTKNQNKSKPETTQAAPNFSESADQSAASIAKARNQTAFESDTQATRHADEDSPPAGSDVNSAPTSANQENTASKLETMRNESKREASEAPGTVLRHAREAKGLELIEIARDLKLDAHLIEDLERGDLHRLPPVYAAGYIRAYAKRVDLEPDELVSEYIAQEASNAPKLKKDKNPLPERYRRVAEVLPKGFSVAAGNAKEQLTKNYGPLAAGVVILFLLVWQVFSIWSSDEEPSGSDIVAMQARDSDAESIQLPSEKEQSDSLQAQIAARQASKPLNSGKASHPSAGEQDSNSATLAKNGNQAENAAAAANSAKNANSKKSDTAQAQDSANKQDTDAIALLEKENKTDLVLTFNRNSWVDIRDATGKHIIRQLGIAGNRQKVSGQAPFQVLLGYGHGVTIEYNGNEVDFSAFQGDRVARFTLEVPKKKIAAD